MLRLLKWSIPTFLTAFAVKSVLAAGSCPGFPEFDGNDKLCKQATQVSNLLKTIKAAGFPDNPRLYIFSEADSEEIKLDRRHNLATVVSSEALKVADKRSDAAILKDAATVLRARAVHLKGDALAALEKHQSDEFAKSLDAAIWLELQADGLSESEYGAALCKTLVGVPPEPSPTRWAGSVQGYCKDRLKVGGK